MSITSNANSTFLNVDNAHLRVSGDIHATAVKVGAIEIVPGYSLESTTGIGNTTPHTVEFTNTETSLVTSGDINMLHSSNNAAIKLNSNVVTEFSRSKKLIKYPRVALTQNALNNGYTVSANAEESAGRAVWKLFDNTGNATAWRSEANGDYNASGAYTGSANLGSDSGGTAFADADKGDWVKIQLPHKIKLDHFTLQVRYSPNIPPGSSISYGRSEFIKNGRVWGSNDGTSWSVVHTISGTSAPSDTAINTYTVTSSIYYRYFGLVITDTNATVTGLGTSLSEIELYGIPEYDPDAHGVDVKVTSYPNVPNTDWLEVYYDAKDLADGAVTTVSDLKPSSLGTALNSSSTNNITVSDDAFVFNGIDSYIKIDDLTNPSGAWRHSVVVWINSSDLGNFDLTWIGDAEGTAARQSFSFHTSGQALTMGISGSNVQFRFASPLVKDKWHHVVYTFNGGAAGSGSTAYKVFVDGVEGHKTGGVGGGTLTLPAQTAIWIGRNLGGTNHFKGKIANFRIFNRALTSDEVWQLYAYQKEYFGHGDLSMTLKSGRLGIGTSEPRAALDVRGDIYGGCPVYFAASATGYRNAASGGAVIVFDRVEVSRGGGYDSSTGVFTVPLAGIYRFDFYARQHGSTAIYARMQKNGSSQTFGRAYFGAASVMGGSTGVFRLNVGDTIQIRLYNNSAGQITNQYNGFIGQYISSL